MKFELYCDDSFKKLKEIESNSIDSVVTDPPYGLGKEPNPQEMLNSWLENKNLETKGSGFMGNKWDAFVPQPAIWKEVIRVLKPGGHVLSFFGTRTYDWGVMAMRLAGFEIRDRIQFLFDDSSYREKFINSLTPEQFSMFSQIMKNGDNESLFAFGTGFPKALDISKAIDKKLGFEGVVVGQASHPTSKNRTGTKSPFQAKETPLDSNYDITEPSSKEAKKWVGWKSALKPANEPIVLARKPLSEKTIAENILKHNVGGMNIDACRVKFSKNDDSRIK